MLLSAAPLAHALPPKRLSTTYTGRPWYCDSARTAAPPRSGPSVAAVAGERGVDDPQPAARAKIAPPPPPSKRWPVEFPSAKVDVLHRQLWGAWFWQCDVVHTCA